MFSFNMTTVMWKSSNLHHLLPREGQSHDLGQFLCIFWNLLYQVLVVEEVEVEEGHKVPFLGPNLLLMTNGTMTCTLQSIKV